MKKRLIFTHALPIELDEQMSQLFDIEIVSFDQLMLRDSVDCHALISILSDQLTAENLAKFPQCEVIAQYAVGVNNIDLDYCAKKGIIVCHTPDVLNAASADLAFSLLTSLARKIPEAQWAVRNNLWHGWNAFDYLGKSLDGIELGIIGMGKIGATFADLCRRSYGMKIFYHNRRPSPQGAALQAQYLELDELCRRCEIISVHTPLTTQTRHLIGEKELGLMRDDAILINTSRGEVIDQDALLVKLKEGKFFGVGLDVMTPEPLPFDHELTQIPRVLITPHIGSAQKQTRETMAWLCWRNCEEVLAGRSAITPVDLV